MAVTQIRNPEVRGPGLLRTQADRGQDRQRSTAVPEAPAVRCHLSPTGSRPLRQTGAVRGVTTARPTPSTSSSPTRRSRPGGPPSRPRRPLVSKPSSPSTGRTTVSSVPRSLRPTSSSPRNSSGKLKTLPKKVILASSRQRGAVRRLPRKSSAQSRSLAYGRNSGAGRFEA